MRRIIHRNFFIDQVSVGLWEALDLIIFVYKQSSRRAQSLKGFNSYCLDAFCPEKFARTASCASVLLDQIKRSAIT